MKMNIENIICAEKRIPMIDDIHKIQVTPFMVRIYRKFSFGD